MSDLVVILGCCVLGLLAHASRHKHWLSWVLRVIIAIFLTGEALSALAWVLVGQESAWPVQCLMGMSVISLIVLFYSGRRLISSFLGAIEQLVSGQLIVALLKKENWSKAAFGKNSLVPNSIPHMVGLWIYVTSIGFLLSSISPQGFKLPSIPIPLPVSIGQLFTYNGIGLVLLAVCGIGIFITRKWKEALSRLGLVKPKWSYVGIGCLLMLVTFFWDYLWSLLTHNLGGNLASKLSGYNEGSFQVGSAIGPSAWLALATALCAGIGEETLIRGALQPVLGILPSALLHGLLHGQFDRAPIFMIQITCWSVLMGICRRYTNTTTTIIGHAGFNFISTFLFAFNP